MISLNKTSITRKLRAWHRDLGFLMVGISLVYAISGILLNHMGEKDLAFKTEEKMVQVPANMSDSELSAYWNKQDDLPQLKKVFTIDEEHSRLMLDRGVGIYSRGKGVVDYEKHSVRKFIFWINRLHYSKVKGWNIMADFFAASLIFFAVSGLLIVKGKHGISGRGKWLLILGILIPIIYVMLS